MDVTNNILTRITEPSKDDYDNDVSDICDHNFVTFDDFGVKNDQIVSHSMILMSKYKGQHGGKKGKKIWAGVSPLPPFWAMPERKHFSYVRCSLKSNESNVFGSSFLISMMSTPSFSFQILFLTTCLFSSVQVADVDVDIVKVKDF